MVSTDDVVFTRQIVVKKIRTFTRISFDVKLFRNSIQHWEAIIRYIVPYEKNAGIHMADNLFIDLVFI